MLMSAQIVITTRNMFTAQIVVHLTHFDFVRASKSVRVCVYSVQFRHNIELTCLACTVFSFIYTLKCLSAAEINAGKCLNIIVFYFRLDHSDSSALLFSFYLFQFWRFSDWIMVQIFKIFITTGHDHHHSIISFWAKHFFLNNLI